MTAEQWNEMYPVGISVQYQPIMDEAFEPPVKTRSEAWELGSGDPVVKIEGRAGGVHIGHLRVCLPVPVAVTQG